MTTKHVNLDPYCQPKDTYDRYRDADEDAYIEDKFVELWCLIGSFEAGSVNEGLGYNSCSLSTPANLDRYNLSDDLSFTCMVTNQPTKIWLLLLDNHFVIVMKTDMGLRLVTYADEKNSIIWEVRGILKGLVM
jgi:hypothetical protein